MSENPTGDRPPETPPNSLAKRSEEHIRLLTYSKVIELLESGEKVPPGQLLSFAAKIGFVADNTSDKPVIKNQNIFAVIKGLPEERQAQILDHFGSELDKARKELTSGSERPHLQ